MDTELLPPQNTLAEETLIGCVLLDAEACDRALAICTAADCYREASQAIMGAVEAVYRRREPVDLLTVSAELRRTGRLETTGGAEYLTACMNRVPTTAHVVQYATIVARNAVLRRSIQEAADVTQAAYAQPEDVGEFLLESAARFDRLHAVRVTPTALSLEDSFDTDMQVVLAGEDGDDTVTLQRTGFPTIDNHLRGLGFQRFVVILGGTKHGKSQFLRQITVETARQLRVKDDPRVVLYFSLEEDRALWIASMFSVMVGLRREAFLPGQWRHYYRDNEDAEKRKARGIVEWPTLPIRPDFSLHSMNSIESAIRRCAREGRLALACVDYFQRIQGAADVDAYKQRAMRFAELSKELAVPIVVPSQLTLSADGKEAYTKGARAIGEEGHLTLEVNRDQREDRRQFLNSGSIIFRLSRFSPAIAPVPFTVRPESGFMVETEGEVQGGETQHEWPNND